MIWCFRHKRPAAWNGTAYVCAAGKHPIPQLVIPKKVA